MATGDAAPLGGKQRLLVFVIVYYAERTLESVLERIPPEIFESFDTEILVVDDASRDRTFAIGHEYKRAHPDIRMTVLRNEYNQGYGGNQKVGFTYAISEGFDFVALLHGDGQYAPEELPRLMRPLVEDGADAVFGSRMLAPFAALTGGMPLYKYLGNRILSTFQNVLLGTKFSEFHSGYRIYAVRELARVPFHLNSNEFHFDTEIILQLLNHGARIAELPIPTYYGDEICRVNGMKYARDVAIATMKNSAHRAGILYQRRFDTSGPGNTHYDVKLGYASSHSFALERVPPRVRVLDIGSGSAGISGELAEKGCEVTAVDREPPGRPRAGVRAIQQDLDEDVTFATGPYDYILLLDVIEHLKNPERFLEQLREGFDHDPRTLILTTGNVAFFVQRLMLFFGQFNYGKAGILDFTHTRLYTFRSMKQLLVDTGFRIRTVRGVPAPFPKVFGDGVLGKLALYANRALIELSPTLFAYQIYIEAEGTPSVQFVLRDSKERSATASLDEVEHPKTRPGFGDGSFSGAKPPV